MRNDRESRCRSVLLPRPGRRGGLLAASGPTHPTSPVSPAALHGRVNRDNSRPGGEEELDCVLFHFAFIFV